MGWGKHCIFENGCFFLVVRSITLIFVASSEFVSLATMQYSYQLTSSILVGCCSCNSSQRSMHQVVLSRVKLAHNIIILMTGWATIPLNSLLFFLLLGLVSTAVPEALIKIPLTFTSNYVYYAHLYLGSSTQKVRVLVDTGSDTLAVFCSRCHNGCLPSQEFDAESSGSFSTLTCEAMRKLYSADLIPSIPAISQCDSQCQFLRASSQCKSELHYGSSELASYLKYELFMDQVSLLPSKAAVQSSVGCIVDQKDFDSGIWGTSLKPANELLESLYSADKQIGGKRLFTICTSGSEAVMNVGEVDVRFHRGVGLTVKVDRYFDMWWKIQATDIGSITFDGTVIRDASLPLGNYGVILDSGTDFIILPTAVVNAAHQKVLPFCVEPNCKQVSAYQIFSYVYKLTDPAGFFASLPDFEVQWGEGVLETPASNYFWNLGEGYWALAMVSAEQFGFPMSILGSIWMNHFDIVFNRENAEITVYPVDGCSEGRRLQSEQEELRPKRARFDAMKKIKDLHCKYGNALSN